MEIGFVMSVLFVKISQREIPVGEKQNNSMDRLIQYLIAISTLHSSHSLPVYMYMYVYAQLVKVVITKDSQVVF